MKVIPPKPFTFEGGKRAVLLLHAFTGSSADVRQLGRYLQKRGYTCHAPIYKGHGVPPEELMKTSYKDWWQDVENGWQKLKNEGYEEIAVAGLSLGGAFTLKLAEEQEVKGIIPMCAPMTTHNNKQRLHKGVLQYAKQQKQLEKKEEDQIKKEMEEFEQLPLDTLDSVNKLVEDVQSLLEDIEAPALVVQAGKDQMVDPKSAEIIYESIGSEQKELKWYEDSPHVITIGPEKDQLHEDIYEFLEQLEWETEK
ncbi:alpha/beta hydrolase [Alteribacillus iranensis]|uniref:Carboxylesterase n=1 Tax=Alteribacillus iranensis TaxID=930128 RepID=A0A1I2EMF8_9BACI|nr:carboxylesterase [Alteribacillus iranensis]SFE93979.1 carboxylesterase [Alteribacillus iranensis]